MRDSLDTNQGPSRHMAFLRGLWSFVKSVALYLGVVAGGLTVFLILAPLFGYLPYSDRPGPGWHGSFPALGWADFWANAVQMASFGIFIALLIALGGAIVVGIIRLTERFHAPLLAVRVGGAILSALVTAYFVMGAGWYIALGLPAWIVSILLGALAGGWFLPRHASPRVVGA